MSTHMTAAQAAQQNNRDRGGQYASKVHGEADFTAPEQEPAWDAAEQTISFNDFKLVPGYEGRKMSPNSRRWWSEKQIGEALEAGEFHRRRVWTVLLDGEVLEARPGFHPEVGVDRFIVLPSEFELADAEPFDAAAEQRAVAEAAGVPADMIDNLEANGLNLDEVSWRFTRSPGSFADMSRKVRAVIDATDEGWTWTPAYNDGSDIIDRYGYLEHPDSNLIVRANVEDLADWASTEGWAQVASIRDGINTAVAGADQSRSLEAVAQARSIRNEKFRTGVKARVAELLPNSFNEARVSQLVGEASVEAQVVVEDAIAAAEARVVELHASRIAGRLSAESWAAQDTGSMR